MDVADRVVALKVPTRLLAEILVLGEWRIVGAEVDELGQVVTFQVCAEAAPEGATEMVPTYQRTAGGTVEMVDPGWLVAPDTAD